MTKLWAILAALLLLSSAACTAADDGQQKATDIADNRRPYTMQHDVEFKNYDERQKISDDPNTIIWCTTAFDNPSSPLITVPIRGKLTSSGKRPYQSDPGPDAMYGGSADYRYGFTPGDVYEDFYNLPTYCTTQPSVWQRQSTTLVLQTDPALADAGAKAKAALEKVMQVELQRFCKMPSIMPSQGDRSL